MNDLYPKDVLENKRYRAQVMLRLTQGSKEQKDIAASYYWNECKKPDTGILFFFNVFLWTYDPRLVGDKAHQPFITYPFQDDYILGLEECYKTGQGGVTDKSRDMGASWMALGWHLWHLIFDDSFQALLGSRKEDYVDGGSVDSLFGKFDYMLDRLPTWFMGEEFYENKKKYRTYMKLINPKNKNGILGESANRDFSRSGRYSSILLDEFAFWDWGNNVWKAVGDSTRTCFAISTSNGKANKFYELVRGIEKKELNIPKFRLHWKLHPKKTKAWYDEECGRRTPIDIARELDISYEDSIAGKMYDNFGALNIVKALTYDPRLPLYIAWDFGHGDPTAMLWIQKDHDKNLVYIIDAYERASRDTTFFVPFVTGVIPVDTIHRYTDEELKIIKRHENWNKATHFGDPTGGNKSQSDGKSVIGVLAENHIYVHTNYKKFKIKARFDDTYRLIPRLLVDDRLEKFIDCIESSRWALPENEYDPLAKNLEPIHDWASHFRTSLEFFAVNEPFNMTAKEEVTKAKKSYLTNPKYRRGAMWSRQRAFHR